MKFCSDPTIPDLEGVEKHLKVLAHEFAVINEKHYWYLLFIFHWYDLRYT